MDRAGERQCGLSGGGCGSARLCARALSPLPPTPRNTNCGNRRERLHARGLCAPAPRRGRGAAQGFLRRRARASTEGDQMYTRVVAESWVKGAGKTRGWSRVAARRAPAGKCGPAGARGCGAGGGAGARVRAQAGACACAAAPSCSRAPARGCSGRCKGAPRQTLLVAGLCKLGLGLRAVRMCACMRGEFHGSRAWHGKGPKKC